MADNLIFPIGFDLQQAVEKAGKEWDKTYAKRLETYLAKRPVKVKLNFENLNDVKTRLAQLKIEPITPETKASIKELARELQVLAKALEQVQKYSKNPAQLGQQNFRNDVQLEKLRQANERLEIQKRRVALAEQKHAEAMKRSASASKQLSSEFQTQEGYVSRLVKRLAVYASFSAVSGLLTNIRQVTAEFELQRVSLGAIIQDQERANQLFGEIKSFALKSPVSILDLTKYTKQIAAYGVETEKLFDTTKMLTDVSVGLGTPLSQLALAFGQIRSQSLLRLAETRQLTEAGIPALELLAKQLEKTYGRFVSTAEVMELISKRAISFEMVEQMFKDMTSAGGAFYNIQEKQGNTLFGMWAKLGDAASVMYDEIGNTESVNSGMKASIALLTTLMKNWKLVGGEMMIVAATMGVISAKSKAHATATALQAAALNKVRTAGIAYNAILAQEAKLTTSATIAQKASIAARKANAKAALDAAIAEKTAANATNVWTRSMNKLKAAFMGNWATILIAAIAAMGVAIYNAVEKANRLKNTLNSIEAERITQTAQSVRNFEYLADAAVKAADGSKEQKDALDELQRTYSDMIPVQDLTIEKLRAMHGNYQSLTTAIKEYIAEQQKQKKLSAIEEEYGNEITDKYKKLSEKLIKGVDINVGGSKIKSRVHLQFSAEEFERAINELEKRATDKTKSLRQKLKESFEAIGYDLSKDQISALLKVGKWGEFDDGYFVSLNNALEEQAERIEAVQKASAKSVGDLGRYKDTLDDITESVKKYRLVNTKGEAVGRDTFLFQQGQQNFKIKKWADSIKSELEGAGVTIQEGIFNLVDKINENDPTKISTIDFSKLMPMLDSPEVKQKLGNSYETFKNYVLSIQKLYDGIVPSDPIVQAVRNNMFAIGNATKGGMDVMEKHLWDGKGSIEDHLKTLKQSAATLESEIYKYSQYIKLFGTAGKILLKMMGVDVDALSAEYDALTKQIAYVQQYVKETDKKDKGGSKSDPRLQNLKEEISLVQKLYNEYKQLEKQEGATKAAADMRRMAGDTLDMFKSKYNIDLPTDAKDLTAALEILYKKMAALPKKVFPSLDKDLKELRWTIEKVDIDESQKNIEAELKRLADRISRTKTAKEFYDKVLGMTGDYDLAAKVSLSIYGDTGYDLQKQLAEQIKEMTGGYGVEVPISIISADNRIDYLALERFVKSKQKELGGIESNTYKELVKIAQEGQKDLAKTYEGYLKDLEKAKTYADKRIELARYTANQIAEINASALPQGEKDRLTSGYKEREKQKQGELEWEAFKDMPMYVQMFDDLDNASGTMLSNMKAKLLELQSVWGSTLNPTQLKELQSRLSEIDAQLAKKNPFKTLSDAMKQYRALSKGGTQADAERKLIEATDKRQAAQQKLNMALDVSRTAQERYNEAVSKYGADSEQAKNAKLFWDAAKSGVEDAGKLVEQTGLSEKEAQRLVAAWKKVKDAIGLSLGEVFQIAHSLGDLAGGIGKLTEVFGGDEEDVQYWNDIAAGLNEVTSGIENMVQAAISGNPIGIVTSAITAIPNMISGFANLFSAGKVRRANKEIKRQQKLLDQLEYTYGRLEKAADKAFGRDYVNNYNQQLKNLQAQQEAYQKQAQAERSKGKKEDKEKTKQFEEQARETADKIKEMQENLVAHFTGQSRADVARQMAKSWIDARASMSDTFAAIKGDYADMIKNMIVEGAAARVIENALTPVWDSMEKMLEKNDVQGAIDSLIGGMDSALNAANNGMEVLWQALEAKGYDMKKLIGDTDSEYTGIAKSVAGATSEEINNVAAIGNTLLYYASPIPRIDENLARVVAIMERGGANVPSSTTTTGWTDWQQQAMDNYQAIARNTAETVVRCERAAIACEKMARVIKTKGATSGFNVFLNS